MGCFEISINDDFTIMVHPSVTNTILNQYDGEMIHVPTEDFFKPSARYLEYHRTNIYGLFLRTGQIRRLT